MREKLLRLLKFVSIGIVAGVFVGALAGWVVAQFLHVPQVDTLETFRPATATHVYADDGTEMASWAVEQRVELKPEDIPDHLKQAIVAIEDADFYNHGGVDPRAVTRAVWYSLRDRKFGSRGGASTLTQQLALNLFLERERTVSRKAKEALLAIDIEKRFSKDQILTMYANQVFFGHGAFGVEAASQLYFNKTAMEISLAEAALLAGMIPSANNLYNPIKRPENALARRNKVLDRMLEQGYIDADQHAGAVAEPLEVALHRDRVASGAYFLEAARKEIEQRYGTNTLYKEGLQVHLTMDPYLQQLAEKSVREWLVKLEMIYIGWRPPPNVLETEGIEDVAEYEHPSWRQLELKPSAMVHALVVEVGRREAMLKIGDHRARLDMEAVKWTGAVSMKRLLDIGDLVFVRLPEEFPEELPEDAEAVIPAKLLQEPEIEGALIAMDNQTGAIRAMVGGFDFGRSEFNRAVQSTLQCGSAFKPFVYLTAFQQGYSPADTLFDGPFLLPDGTGELTYCPKNYYNIYYGITTLRRALELSYNATAVKLQQLVGSEQVVETARRFGISTELHPYPSLALGSLGVRLVDLVRAYSAIANLGELPDPYFISEVYDRDSRPLERFYPRIEPIMSAPATYLALHVLRGVIERGTGQSARWLDANLAGKTGTTDDYSDAWFVGFSPRMTVGVWVGRDRKEAIGKKMTGAKAAQPIWNEFMKGYLDTLDEATRAEDFSVPAGVVFTPVDAYTGERAVPPCSHQTSVVLEAFLDGTEPSEPCREQEIPLRELPWPFQLPFYEPKPGEPMPDSMSMAAADERLKPTPTEAEAAAIAAEEAAAAAAEAAGTR